MSRRLQPVSTNDFRKKLKKNGFQFSRSNTGHEIWERKQSLSIPVHNKEICGGIAKRLSREYNLKDWWGDSNGKFNTFIQRGTKCKM